MIVYPIFVDRWGFHELFIEELVKNGYHVCPISVSDNADGNLKDSIASLLSKRGLVLFLGFPPLSKLGGGAFLEFLNEKGYPIVFTSFDIWETTWHRFPIGLNNFSIIETCASFSKFRISLLPELTSNWHCLKHPVGYFPPNTIKEERLGLPWNERDIPVLMPVNLSWGGGSLEDINESILCLNKHIRAAIEEVCSFCFNRPDFFYLDVLLSYLKERGSYFQNIHLRQLARLVWLKINLERRNFVFERVLKYPVMVTTNTLPKWFDNSDKKIKATVIKEWDIDETQRRYLRSKYVIDVPFYFKTTHDRVHHSILSGAVPITATDGLVSLPSCFEDILPRFAYDETLDAILEQSIERKYRVEGVGHLQNYIREESRAFDLSPLFFAIESLTDTYLSGNALRNKK